MAKKFLTFGILLIVLMGVLVPRVTHAQNTDGACSPEQLAAGGITREAGALVEGRLTLSTYCQIAGNSSDRGVFGGFLDPLVQSLFKGVGQLLMLISSLFLILSGKLFDIIVNFTVIEMAKNIGTGTGVGGGITAAWATLRDIANMCFIFVLLFAAFKAMFDTNFGNFGTTVKNIIIVALLINFSLFFSKVVIDASNIVSVGFYKSIVTSNQTSLTTGSGTINQAAFSGISGGYMKMLGMQTFYSANILDSFPGEPLRILTLGIVSSIFMLITAVILLISAIMFAARFIILIFLMILSPLALIAYIIPGQQKQFDSWKDSLISQSFFAPLFFALTWVVFKVGSTLVGAIPGNPVWTDLVTKADAGSMNLLLFYVLITGLSIAALVISKQMATSGATGGAFKAISGGIGTGVVGGTAWGLRTSVGLPAKWLSERAGLQTATKSNNFFARTGARAALYASEKARSATFDARNASIPTSVVGDAIQGTLGRTKYGKKLGLDDVNIPSIGMNTIVNDMDLLGKGGDKGYKETKEESDKRVHEREAKAASELAIAQAKKDIMDGAGATIGSPAYDAMEKALSKLSDKETETLVASNRELLKSQNFANAISVKQLEALNKSDQFSESEKGTLKGTRFKEIEAISDTAGLAAVAKRSTGAPLTPAEIASATRVETARSRTKDLSDSELEMISSNYLDPTSPEGREFISQLKAGQVETITKNKSGKFAITQRENVKRERMRPLLDALAAGRLADIQSIVKRADIKTRVSYMKVDGRGTPPIKIALDPAVLPTYNSKTLSRMAANDDMTDNDISTLRTAILAALPATHPTVVWLNDPNKGMVEFPP